MIRSAPPIKKVTFCETFQIREISSNEELDADTKTKLLCSLFNPYGFQRSYYRRRIM
jgi:hypothetical protein